MKIDAIFDHLEMDHARGVGVLGGEDNFRLLLPSPQVYKGNRKDMIRPLLLEECRNYVEYKYHAKVVNGIEGDPAAQQAIRYNIYQLYQTYRGDNPRLNIAPNGWFSLCVPFEVTTFPMNTTVYDVESIDESAQRVAIAATSMIGADSPVIFNWAGNSGEFKLNVSNAAVKTTSSASLTNGLLSGTYLNGEAGSLIGKYALRADGTGFGRCTATAYGVPFRAFLNTISPALFISIYDPITGIGFIENDNEKTSGYDLLGRPVSKPTQGIFIINGKKEIIK